MLLRGPVEPGRYTSIDYTHALAENENGVLASVGSVGDADDNALAESFVDSSKTELIAERVWRSRTQLELVIVEYVDWFNDTRLHGSLGDLPPREYELLHAPAGSGCARSPGSLRGTRPSQYAHEHELGNQVNRSPSKSGRLT